MTAELDARLLAPAEVPVLLRESAARRNGFADEYPFPAHWYQTPAGIQHYVDAGQGPPLLMVHGNPTWSFAWRHLITDLSRDHRVIAIDHLGCGFSEAPQNRDAYTLDGHIRRLMALVTQLDLQDVTLFGHDWGGAIGMGTAGRMPERFRRFVLMNTGAFRSQAMPWRIAACRIPLLGELGVRGGNLFARAALKMAVEQPLSAAARAGLIAPYNSWARRIAVHEFVQDIPLNANHRSWATLTGVENSLQQFRSHPMQLIWGLRDWCFTPQAFLSEFERRFPDARVAKLPEAGHYVFEDARAEVIRTSREFLSHC
jgi:haloalkane dehalogenase